MNSATTSTARARLAGFVARFDPAVARVGTKAIARLRKRLPGARVLVYDNYNALAVGFGPTERASQAVLSIAFFPRWVSLFFLHGANLPDPLRRLKGSGRQVRHLVLRDATDLDDPYVASLIGQAVDSASPAFPTRGGGLMVKSISPTRRPRRPRAKGSSR